MTTQAKNNQEQTKDQAEEKIVSQNLPQGTENETQNDDITQSAIAEDVINVIKQIEPAAGEENTGTSDAVSQIALNSNNFKPQSQSSQSLGLTKATGILEETELEYANVIGSTLNSSENTVFQRLISTEEQTTNIDTPLNFNTPPVTLTLPEAMIKLSNATTNQKYINDADHYQIKVQDIGKNYALFGNEMDIQNVSDTSLVRYKFNTDDNFRAVLKSDWNSVKNIEIESTDLDTVFVKNFVQADINLNGDSDKTIKIIDAKRGFIETDNGNDTINVKAMTNGGGWSNTFEINSGAGNDKITLRGDAGHTIANIDAGTGNDIVKMHGNYEHADIDLGAGDDIFKNGKHADTVFGGEGNDIIKGGAGHDVLYGGNTILPNPSLMATQLDFEFVKSQAGYKNTVGFYEVAADGSIENTQIVFENLKALNAGDEKSFEVDTQTTVKTFIVANGYNQNGRWQDFDFENGTFSFVYNNNQPDQRTANVNDDANAINLIYTDADQTIKVKGHVFHDIEDLNKDAQDHSIESINGNQTEHAYEDLYNLGDRDYSDAVFNLTQSPVYQIAYENKGDDNDILRGGSDNDVIIGGYGDDIIKGGSDTDIAVFMGSMSEYSITKTGGKYIIEDSVENRDGIDTLSGIEGLLFGIQDLYLDTLSNWTEEQVLETFDVQSTEDLDLSDLVEGYTQIQDAIDNFVENASTSTTETVSVQSNVTALAITTIQDALSQSITDIL
ncbi:MAG: hypothetical protein AB8B83_08305 [Bdellovibrionales bacterium]